MCSCDCVCVRVHVSVCVYLFVLFEFDMFACNGPNVKITCRQPSTANNINSNTIIDHMHFILYIILLMQFLCRASMACLPRLFFLFAFDNIRVFSFNYCRVQVFISVLFFSLLLSSTVSFVGWDFCMMETSLLFTEHQTMQLAFNPPGGY